MDKDKIDIKEQKKDTKSKSKKSSYSKKKKTKKNLTNGIAYVQSTFNNTIISIADTNGNVISWASAGQKGFKGSRKSTPYAAQIAADDAAGKAQKHGLKVIEDCAQAHGAESNGKKVGSLSDAGAFSFQSSKNLTSGEGGMVTTNDERLARSIQQRKAFGYDHNHQTRARPGIYDVPVLGYNYRMNEVEAAVGLCQLSKLKDRLKVRMDNYTALKSALAGLDEITVFEPRQGESTSSCYCLNAVLTPGSSINRDNIVQELTAQGIGTSVHYPGPIPMMSYYKEKYDYLPGQFPIAEWLSNKTISLPVAPHVPKGFENRIASAIKKAVHDARKNR